MLTSELVDMVYDTAGNVACTRMLSPTLGSPMRTTDWLPTCTRTYEQTASATLSFAVRHQTYWHEWRIELT